MPASCIQQGIRASRAGSLAARERLRAGAGREGQHRLTAVGAACQGWPGGKYPHRAAWMLAHPAERDRGTIVKRRYQRLQPLRGAQIGLVLADGGVLAGVRAARDLGDLPGFQVPQHLPCPAVHHDVPRLHPLGISLVPQRIQVRGSPEIIRRLS